MTDAEIEAALAPRSATGWAALWAAVDRLDQEATTYAWAGGAIRNEIIDGVEEQVAQFPWVSYGDTLIRIMELLYELRVVVNFDWPAWQEKFLSYPGGKGLEDKPVADSVRMITAILRADRFSEGTLAKAVDDGSFQVALRRLRRWHLTAAGR